MHPKEFWMQNKAMQYFAHMHMLMTVPWHVSPGSLRPKTHHFLYLSWDQLMTKQVLDIWQHKTSKTCLWGMVHQPVPGTSIKTLRKQGTTGPAFLRLMLLINICPSDHPVLMKPSRLSRPRSLHFCWLSIAYEVPKEVNLILVVFYFVALTTHWRKWPLKRITGIVI